MNCIIKEIVEFIYYLNDKVDIIYKKETNKAVEKLIKWLDIR